MFGFIICDKNGLSEEERDRYQKYYCGLCLALKEKYGQMSRFALNYDMTFLALFLSSLYEPEETVRELRCVSHPWRKQQVILNPYVEYAAAMTVALTYYKCQDDWEDDHSLIGKNYGKILEKSFRMVEKEYPRQCQQLKKSLRKLHEIENNPKALADEAVNSSGEMLAEVFVPNEDFWCQSLRRFGYEIGRFIYLMDAAVDWKSDRKKKNYNPLIRLKKTPEDIKEILESEIGNATRIFEVLPMVQDAHLIRNILYCGVWQKYKLQRVGKEHKHGAGSV